MNSTIAVANIARSRTHSPKPVSRTGAGAGLRSGLLGSASKLAVDWGSGVFWGTVCISLPDYSKSRPQGGKRIRDDLAIRAVSAGWLPEPEMVQAPGTVLELDSRYDARQRWIQELSRLPRPLPAPAAGLPPFTACWTTPSPPACSPAAPLEFWPVAKSHSRTRWVTLPMRKARPQLPRRPSTTWPA